MRNIAPILIICLLLSLSVSAQKKGLFPFMDLSLSFEERVDDLVARMTMEEKADQLLYTAPAIPRLGIPEYNWWNEALHGVARSGWATVFPQSITLAASWDEDLMFEVASIISDEARAKFHDYQRRGMRGIYQGLTFWSPNINIFRDPRWGRGHETYGEDPYLTGRMGLQFVLGMQGDNPEYLKTVATAKHYAVHSGPEPIRHEFNAQVSEVDLRETYLPAFRTLVVDGNVRSVMGAYNMFRGHPCCASEELYGILREEWGFDGYIVSDCWAISDFHTFQDYTTTPVESAAIAVKRGTDLNCGVTFQHLAEAVEKGLITENDIDVAVKRIMLARFKLGLFDPDSLVPYAGIPISVNCSDYHSSMAREAARKSVVLLKNDGLLPLGRHIKRIAVIGPNADNFEALIGNYNGIPVNPITILEGIRNKTGKTSEVVFSEGSHLAEGLHNLFPIPSEYFYTDDGEQGVYAEYYDNINGEGAPVFTRVDDNICFYWETYSPHPDIPHDNWSVKWTGWLKPPETGKYFLGSWGSSNYEIFIDGEKFISYTGSHHAFHREKGIELEKDSKYRLEIIYRNLSGDADMKFLWAPPQEDILENAVSAAQSSDIVLLVLGLSQRLEGEEMPIDIDGFRGGDRTHLELPAVQKELFDRIMQTGKPVIVILMNGSALSVNDMEKRANAIMLAGYPGQEGGNAVADVIFGDYNPAGRLPVTWYKSVEQLPPFEDYDMEGRTYRYFKGEPLYPFGYGLSYTTFEYSNLEMPEKVKEGNPINVKVTVKNTGNRKGEEVVQLYITDETGSTPRPLRELRGFRRINLEPGESENIEFTLEPQDLSMIDKNNNRVTEPGWFTVSVGGKQPGFKGRLDPEFTQVLSGRIRYQ
ncbi:MAG: glycoside hydrolase family 3 C-terminal domain-containing protein [Bacteroidales bacterium]|nr:glycoside hydrolase family 3 C-terminal domain-containing protein [Bacteroidales bacterium]